jgi:hypothetical protein
MLLLLSRRLGCVAQDQVGSATWGVEEGDFGGRERTSRPHLRYELENGGNVHMSKEQAEFQARRFFSNTFASEGIDEKMMHMCALLSRRYIFN